MSNRISWAITMIALVAMALMYWTRDQVLEQGEHVFRTVHPMTSHTEELNNRERVAISEARALEPDQEQNRSRLFSGLPLALSRRPVCLPRTQPPRRPAGRAGGGGRTSLGLDQKCN